MKGFEKELARTRGNDVRVMQSSDSGDPPRVSGRFEAVCIPNRRQWLLLHRGPIAERSLVVTGDEVLLVDEAHAVGRVALDGVEDELRLLRDFPNTNRRVTATGSDGTLASETVDRDDLLLVTEQRLDVRHLGQTPHLDRFVGGAGVQVGRGVFLDRHARHGASVALELAQKGQIFRVPDEDHAFGARGSEVLGIVRDGERKNRFRMPGRFVNVQLFAARDHPDLLPFFQAVWDRKKGENVEKITGTKSLQIRNQKFGMITVKKNMTCPSFPQNFTKLTFDNRAVLGAGEDESFVGGDDGARYREALVLAT